MQHAERATFLRASARGLDERAEDVAQTWPNEMGILHSGAKSCAGSMGGIYDYYAGLADTFAFEEPHTPSAGGEFGLLVREPVGVVAAIIPWNAPINLIANKLAPELIAGCTVIIKASPEAPSSAYIMAAIAQAVGLPPGVINVIRADRAVSDMLVRHPGEIGRAHV